MKHSRITKGCLVVLLIVIACAVPNTFSRADTQSTITVEVMSGNYYANTVRVLCDNNSSLSVIRGIVMNQREVKRINLSGCRSIILRVESIGRDYWVSEHIPADAGNTIMLNIAPSLSLSSIWVR